MLLNGCFTFVRFEVLNPLYHRIQVFWDFTLWWWASSSKHFEVTQNLHLQGSQGTRRMKKPKRILCTVSVIHDILIANLREGHICIMFHLKLWKTALEKLETQSGFPVAIQIPNSSLFSGKAHSLHIQRKRIKHQKHAGEVF